MPAGVERQRCRWARKASTLDGAAARSSRSRRGLGDGAGTGAAEDGTGSPDGRSVVGGSSVDDMVARALYSVC